MAWLLLCGLKELIKPDKEYFLFYKNLFYAQMHVGNG